MVDKVTVVRFSVEGEKFELLVKPDPALEYKFILILTKEHAHQLKN